MEEEEDSWTRFFVGFVGSPASTVARGARKKGTKGSAAATGATGGVARMRSTKKNAAAMNVDGKKTTRRSAAADIGGAERMKSTKGSVATTADTDDVAMTRGTGRDAADIGAARMRGMRTNAAEATMMTTTIS